MTKKIALIFFLAISVLVLFSRFYHLGSIPVALNADEASHGYNAYSILKTGRDVHKRIYPLTLKSFGDYKTVGLTYILVLLLKFLPLSALTVRLPSALAGLLILPILYLTFDLFFHRPKLNLILTLIFALSPWTFVLSRLFFEANVGLFFLAVSIYYFFRWQLKNQPPSLWFYLSLALSGYFYQPFRYFALAILGLFLFLVFKAKSKPSRLGLGVFLLFFTPLLFEMFNPVGLKRLFQENYKQNLVLTQKVIYHRQHCQLLFHQPTICRWLWNRPVLKLSQTATLTWKLISPQFLFFEGKDGFQVLPPGYGAFLPLLLLAYFLVILSLPQFKSQPYFWSFSFIFLISLIPLLSVGELSLHRSLFHLYLTFILFGLSFHYFYPFINKIMPYFFLIYFFLFMRFLLVYFVDFSFFQKNIWQTNDAALYHFLGSHLNNETVIIDNSPHLSPPLYFAFFNRFDPQRYQDQVRFSHPDQVGNFFAVSLSNFYFTQKTTLPKLLKRYQQNPHQNILYVTKPQPNYSHYAIFQDRQPDGKILIEVYSIKSLYHKLNKTP